MTDRPTFGSLFSGIGGIDLGMERAGFQCLWQSEIEPYACRVLKKHWPDVPNLGDIRDIDWTGIRTPDVVAGGYPCQPFSYAGARNGENDPRHLWPMFADCIRVLRPRYALLENVSGHLSLGFGPVLADLATLGYDARWDCIPAAAVGAPHLRDRVFVIATRRDGMDTDCDSESGRTVNGSASTWPSPMADTHNGRHIYSEESRKPHAGRRSPNVADTGSARLERAGNGGATADRSRQNGTAWETEPDVGRVADGVPHRMDRLRGLGNAVVPQVAEHVARIIINDLRYRNDRNGTALLEGPK